MPCYHPIPARITPDRGKKRVEIHPTGEPSHWLPCGKCLGCREIKQQELSLRLKHEAKFTENNHFLTLTYDEEHEPSGLDKRELQNFWKRLRKKLEVQTMVTKNTLKYLACGEYGDKRQRPHYHAAALNLPLNNLKQWDKENKTSELLTETWGNGIVTVSELTDLRIDYVAGYVLKKAGYKKQYYTTKPTYIIEDDGTISGEWREILQEPYRDMSKGLGKKWIEKYATDVQHGYVKNKGAKHTIPRYYREIIKSTNEKLHQQIENKKAENWKELTPEDRRLLHNQEKIRQMQIRQYRANRVL